MTLIAMQAWNQPETPTGVTSGISASFTHVYEHVLPIA